MKTKAPLLALTALAILGAVSALHAAEANREKAAENFLQADADADGALTQSEFRTLIDLNAEDGIGRAATLKRLGRYDQAFRRIDADGDGRVTPEEVQALVAAARG